MVTAHDAGLMAVNALIAVSSEHKRRCRERLRSAVERLEAETPGTQRGGRIAREAAQCIRTACVACSRCPGI